MAFPYSEALNHSKPELAKKLDSVHFRILSADDAR
jgi:hypothetical protein